MADPEFPGGAWRGRKSQRAALMRLSRVATYWRDPAGVAYATVATQAGVLHHEVSGAAFRQWIARAYFDECGGAPSPAALNEVVSDAAARGSFSADVRPVFLRVGADRGDILLDACDRDGVIVRIASGGVSAERDAAVAFRRVAGAAPLALPQGSECLSALREFINVTDDDWPLVAGWLVAAVRPTGPFPVLFLHGEQGSGKSTQARVLRALIDPNFAALRAAPRDLQDLAIAAHNNWVITMDNLSAIPAWLSDALCRLSTGGGFATRALYANDRETVFHAQRPVLVTGIEDVATRGDLLDRSLVIQLPVLRASRRRAEAELWSAFEAARPALMGALCAAARMALCSEAPFPGGELPRLADFAAWASRAAPGFGSSASDFAASYARGVAEYSAAAVEGNPLARPLVRIALAGEWRGTAAELGYAVEAVAGRLGVKRAGWPRSTIQFAGCVRRLAPSMRSIGVCIDFEREAGTGRRMIVLRATGAARALAAGWDSAASGRPCQLGLLDPLGSAADDTPSFGI